jgi:hypothetical protein
MNSPLKEEVKHTPGPWYPIAYGGFWDIQTEKYYGETSVLNEDSCPNAEANATLAARAPELLAETLSLREQNEKLQKFKDYVHDRLDKMGVPIDPESPHKAAGCRIGGRLDHIEQQNEKLKADKKAMQEQINLTADLIIAIHKYIGSIRGSRLSYDKNAYDEIETISDKLDKLIS